MIRSERWPRAALAAWLWLAAPTVQAEPASLPPGWQLEGQALVWTSPVPLRMGGARYEFRTGERLLGYPVQAGDRLRLRRAPAMPSGTRRSRAETA